MSHRRNRRKKDLARMFVFLVLCVFFVCSVGFVSKKVTTQSGQLKEIKTKLMSVQDGKVSIETSLNDLKVRKQEFEEQVQTLQEQLNELKEKNPTLKLPTEGENAKYAYLTFDDGPSQNTIKILDFLKANNIKATFFVLGKQSEADVYKRIVDEGHTIAIHSNTHQYNTIYKSVDNFMADITELTNLIEKSTGVRPNVMRFPGGSNNTISKKYGGENIMNLVIPEVEKAGYVYFDWNVDSRDASKGRQDTQVIVDSVLNGAKYLSNRSDNPKAVILMHDAAAKTTTVEALPAIVEGLKNQGYIFKELTADTEPVHFK